jgi:hypothetical protein
MRRVLSHYCLCLWAKHVTEINEGRRVFHSSSQQSPGNSCYTEIPWDTGLTQSTFHNVLGTNLKIPTAMNPKLHFPLRFSNKNFECISFSPNRRAYSVQPSWLQRLWTRWTPGIRSPAVTELFSKWAVGPIHRYYHRVPETLSPRVKL